MVSFLRSNSHMGGSSDGDSHFLSTRASKVHTPSALVAEPSARDGAQSSTWAKVAKSRGRVAESQGIIKSSSCTATHRAIRPSAAVTVDRRGDGEAEGSSPTSARSSTTGRAWSCAADEGRVIEPLIPKSGQLRVAIVGLTGSELSDLRLVALQFLQDRRVDRDHALAPDVRLLHGADHPSRSFRELAVRRLDEDHVSTERAHRQ